MLMCYPLDGRSLHAVAKSISSFALLKHMHEPKVLSCLIVKAVLHDDRRIPPDVVVLLGSGPATKTWTVPVFLISRQDVVIPQDEQPVPPDGLAHPIPPEAPGWAGLFMQPPQGHAQGAPAAELSEVREASIGNVHDDSCSQRRCRSMLRWSRGMRRIRNSRMHRWNRGMRWSRGRWMLVRKTLTCLITMRRS